MTPAEAAKALKTLADRVGRLTVKSSNPEQFFIERSEIETDLVKLAGELAPGRIEAARKPDSTFRPGSIAHRGRHVSVETRGGRKKREPSDEIRKVFG